MANTKKSLLRFVLFGGVLTLTLTGCGQNNYKSWEECRLNEMKEVSRSGKDLSPDAVEIVTSYCTNLETEKAAQEKSAKVIRQPNWQNVGPGKGYSAGVRLLVDDNSIETDGFKKTFWVKMLEKGQTIEGKDFKLYKAETDCSARTMTTLTEKIWVNNRQISENSISDAGDITPGSSGADIYQYICEKK